MSASTFTMQTDAERPIADARFGLTSQQMAIWLDQALYPGTAIYNTGQIITICAALDVRLFEAALEQTIAETDALRLRFVQQGGEVLQDVRPAQAASLLISDFTSQQESEQAARAWLEGLFWEPLAPTAVPLFKFALARVTSDRFLWLQKYHHLIIDATGRRHIASRVAQIYDARLAGRQPPAAASHSFSLAKRAEDEYLASPQYAADRAYWTSRFTTLPKPIVEADLALTEKRRSGVRGRCDCDLTPAMSDSLRSFARGNGTTVFKVIVALTWAYFFQLKGDSDLVIGVPVAGRSGETAKIVGLFSRVLPFRPRIDPRTPFGAVLSTLDSQLADDLKHQRYPAGLLNRDVQLRRAGRFSLYDAVVNYVRNDYSFGFADSSIDCENISSGLFVPWSVMAMEFGGDAPIRIVVDYDSGRVHGDEAERFLDWLRAAIIAIPGLIEAPVGTLLAEHVAVVATERDVRDKAAIESGRFLSTVHEEASRPDQIEQRLTQIWCAAFAASEIGRDADYFQLGGDSLRGLTLIAQCNEAFGIDLPLTALFECPTIARLAATIRNSTAAARTDCIVKLRDGGSLAPLILVHPAGGAVFCYRDLASGLAAGTPVYGIQAPGLLSGGGLPETLEGLAEMYVGCARAMIGDARWHLAGWSFGGLVAFAMAHVLARTANPHLSLTMIDTPASAKGLADDERSMLSLIAGALGIEIPSGTAGNGIPAIAEMIAQRAKSSANEAQSTVQIESLMSLVRDVRRLRRQYRPRLLEGGLTLIRAAADPNASGLDFDWTGLVRKGVDEIRLPATHESIVKPPHAVAVADILNRILVREARVGEAV